MVKAIVQESFIFHLCDICIYDSKDKLIGFFGEIYMYV